MQFYFIRHGQSENNLLWEETGSSHGRNEDPELTEKGVRQAKLLAKFLQQKDKETNDYRNRDMTRDDFHFTHLYSSLMVRSVKTGSILAETLGITLHAWPDIHECGGMYLDDAVSKQQVGLPGKTRSYLLQHYKNLHLPKEVTEAGWYNRSYEAELDRPIRAKRVVQTLLERHGNSEDRVAIVSHGGFYNELVRVLFAFPGNQAWFLMNNTGISRFDFWGDANITLIYHNRTDHLEQGDIS